MEEVIVEVSTMYASALLHAVWPRFIWVVSHHIWVVALPSRMLHIETLACTEPAPVKFTAAVETDIPFDVNACKLPVTHRNNTNITNIEKNLFIVFSPR
jgi:hypothetical protein